MRLLYVSDHPVLEYDETALLFDMGISVWSLMVCQGAEDQRGFLRPKPAISSGESQPLESFDAILSSSADWLVENWNKIKTKRVIWRTCGRSNQLTEERMKPFRGEGLEIVRYSPREASINGYLGAEAFIRFFKDPEIYQGWTGHRELILNYTRNMRYRGRECNLAFLKKIVRGIPFKLVGPQNENIDEPWASGVVSFNEMLTDLRTCRAYFYTGTHPACYTLSFVEAWMTGIPVVGLGRGRGSDPQLSGHGLYEIPDLVEHGRTGFHSDDEVELRQILQDLLHDHSYAEAIGQKGRRAAVQMFGKDAVLRAWREFL